MKSVLLIHFLSMFLMFSGFSSFAFPDSEGGGEVNEKANDTIRQLVYYGHEYQVRPSVKKSEEFLFRFIDSLFTNSSGPAGIRSQIELYLRLSLKNENELVALIDSLFELDDVPVGLINQVNFLVSLNSLNAGENDAAPVSVTAFYEGAEFPAHCFYGVWDTELTNPYSNELWKNDTARHILVLQDPLNFCDYHHPIIGAITSAFGMRQGRNHYGIDINLNTGDPVVSAFDGMVRVAKYHNGYGNVVIVRHYNGLETIYAHLHKIKVKPGQEVIGGQLIGLGGSTGRSTGAHLHFEMRFKGVPLNPKHIVDFQNNELLADAFVLNKNRWSYSVFPEGAGFHKVQKGEYLYAIANRYGISVAKLCELNGISRNTILKVGQELRIS